RSRIHPEDRDWVEKRLRDAIIGTCEYDVEYRIIWPDKTIHWVTSRAKLLLDEQKHPVRLIGVTQDITARKQREQAFQSMLECAKNNGSRYFESLVKALAEAFQVRYAFIAEVEAQFTSKAKPIAFWADGKLDNTFVVDDTLGAGVMSQGISFYPAGVRNLFPRNQLFTRLQVEGYLCTALKNSDGEVIGLMVVMHDKPISDTLHPLSLLQMFAGQASIAMEREQAEQALRDSEERLRLVMEAANVGTWDWHLNNNY